MATLKEILADEATAKELAAQGTEEAALAYLQGKGVEVTREELKATLQQMAGALSDDELETVAGGGKKIKVYKITERWWILG